jgi:hypothetical protein
MAVVQISKIQVRRGRKLGESGIPQLSSGEMAWTVDTQELFIGNGAVAEGAPAVGNTKVLTEHDNLLELIQSYRFGRNSPSITKSVFRTLQSKLDDRVNVKDFGAKGDGVADDTEAFQNALDQLFRNTDNEFRKQLFVPTGHYRILGNITIPSAAYITGESDIGTIIAFNAVTVSFTSFNGTQPINFSSSDRPHDVYINNLTMRFTTGHCDLTGLADSTFEAVIFQGAEATLLNAINTTNQHSLIMMTNTDNIGTVISNVEFKACVFKNAWNAVFFEQTQSYHSEVYFSQCKFNTLNTGIIVDGQSGQINAWGISESLFQSIGSQAIRSIYGSGMKIVDSKFIDCGNGINLANNPEDYIITFLEPYDNVVLNCYFNRQQNAYADVAIGDQRRAIQEVFNGSMVTIADQIKQDLYNSLSISPLAMFSALNRSTTLDYTINFASGSARSGTLTITIGDNTLNPVLTDSYAVTQGDLDAEAVEFVIQLLDRSDSTAGSETIILNYKNPNNPGINPDQLTYFVKYSV